ncbi:MAG: CRTAC1 family protein [Alphaproteobacteria bacterium]|nr:CRTAC1 family protein [Alphaproteobacteria bacterium]
MRVLALPVVLLGCTLPTDHDPDTGDSTDASDTLGDTGGGDTDDTDDTDDTGQIGTTGEPATVEVRATPTPCAAPDDRQTLGWWMRERRTTTTADPSSDLGLTGGALALDDLDGDGHLDLVVLDKRSTIVHLGNGSGALGPKPAWTFGHDLEGATSGTLVDLDDDGDLDLFVTRWKRPPVALRNDGAAPLVDVSAELGLDVAPELRWMGAAFGDVDRDGDLDLFLVAYGVRPKDAFADASAFEPGDASVLLLRTPSGFEPAPTPMPPAVTEGHTFGGAFVDVDGDVWPELVVINDFGWARPSQILWNRAGTLGLDPLDQAGFAIPFAGMGLGIGDLNGDGTPDWVQSSWNETSALVSQQGVYFDEAQARGLVPFLAEDAITGQSFGWGAQLVDVDLDGDLDAPIAYGYWADWGGFEVQPDGLFLQGPDGTFTDVAAAQGLAAPEAGRGLVTGDLDGDGYPDLVVRHLREGLDIHLSRCGTGRALEVELRQPGRPNPFAAGARVDVVTSLGSQRRWVVTGTHGLFSAGPHRVHVGLGDATEVRELRVRWPDGGESILREPVAPGRIRIERGPPG